MGKKRVQVKPLRDPRLDARDGSSARIEHTLQKLMAATERNARQVVARMMSGGEPPDLEEWTEQVNGLLTQLGAPLAIEHVLVLAQGIGEGQKLDVFTASSFALNESQDAVNAARDLLALGLDTLPGECVCDECDDDSDEIPPRELLS